MHCKLAKYYLLHVLYREEVINGDAIRNVLLPSNRIFAASVSTISPPKDQNRIEDVKLPGALQHPSAISLLGDRIYWTDWATYSIHSLLKNGTGLPRVIKKDDISPMDIQTYSKTRQKAGEVQKRKAYINVRCCCRVQH